MSLEVVETKTSLQPPSDAVIEMPWPIQGTGPLAPAKAPEVLIVDDDDELRHFCKCILRDSNYNCRDAADGLSALAAIRRLTPDIILLDLELPGMKGEEVLNRVRQLVPSDCVKVLLISGHAHPDQMAALLASGADDFVVKPFNAVQLRARTQNLLKLKKYQDRIREQNQLLARHARTSEARFQQLLHSAADGIVAIDRNGRIILANDCALRLFDHKQETVIGSSVELLLPGWRWDCSGSEGYEETSNAHAAQMGVRRKLTGRRRDGTAFPVELSLSPLATEGELLVTAVIRDISDRVQSEKRLIVQHAVSSALAASHTLAEAAPRMLQSLAEVGDWTSAVMWCVDAHEHTLKIVSDWRSPDAEASGIPVSTGAHTTTRPEGLAGRVWAAGKPGWVIDMNVVADFGTAAITSQKNHNVAFAFPIRLGHEVLGVIEFAGQSIYAPDEHLLRLYDDLSSQIGQFMDRKRTEDKLLQAHRENHNLLSAISSILISLDRNDCIKRWNATAAHVFDLAEDAVLGKSLGDCPLRWRQPEDRERLLRSCRTAHQERVEELHIVTAGGEDRTLTFTIYPIIENGKRSGSLLLGLDVTEKKYLEDELRRAQKLESIGQLAAGIAHEINTPIQYISDNTLFLRDACTDLLRMADALVSVPEAAGAEGAAVHEKARATVAQTDLDYLRDEIPRAIQQTMEGITSVARIVRSMKEFSHPGSDEKIPTDIHKGIENTITVARNEWKYVAEIAQEFDDTLPLVPCIPGEMNQVFLNLLVNAAHAIADCKTRESYAKGLITIRTRRQEQEALISITDSGCGIPESIRARIFDPFFTTKPPGKGTGQGLAIVHSVVVKKHHGRISVVSEVGKGTTFTICLPLVAESTG